MKNPTSRLKNIRRVQAIKAMTAPGYLRGMSNGFAQRIREPGRSRRTQGIRVGYVPQMGALGHDPRTDLATFIRRLWSKHDPAKQQAWVIVKDRHGVVRWFMDPMTRQKLPIARPDVTRAIVGRQASRPAAISPRP